MLPISEQQSTYPLALLLTSGGKKTREALGRSIKQSGDLMIRSLDNNSDVFDYVKLRSKLRIKVKLDTHAFLKQ